MKKHKFEFTENELMKLYLAIKYYNTVAEQMDNLLMMAYSVLLQKVQRMAFTRWTALSYSKAGKTKVTMSQLDVDLIWTCLGEYQEVRDVLLKIGSKTHTYTN